MRRTISGDITAANSGARDDTTDVQWRFRHGAVLTRWSPPLPNRKASALRLMHGKDKVEEVTEKRQTLGGRERRGGGWWSGERAESLRESWSGGEKQLAVLKLKLAPGGAATSLRKMSEGSHISPSSKFGGKSSIILQQRVAGALNLHQKGW